MKDDTFIHVNHIKSPKLRLHLPQINRLVLQFLLFTGVFESNHLYCNSNMQSTIEKIKTKALPTILDLLCYQFQRSVTINF